MVSALEALRRGSLMADAVPESMQAFGISSGVRSGLAQLFSSHPPLEDRIAALQAG